MAQQPQNLVVEAGECLNLSPDSDRFKAMLKQIRPQSIAEVRAALGPSARTDGKEGGDKNAAWCCSHQDLPSVLPDADALEAEDDEVRYRARAQAYLASREYVRAVDPVAAAYWEPVLDRFIKINKALLNVFTFNDIEIANGGTLSIPQNTHALYAANIRMYGTGRMVCRGPTTVRATSLQGKIYTKTHAALPATKRMP